MRSLCYLAYMFARPMMMIGLFLAYTGLQVGRPLPGLLLAVVGLMVEFMPLRLPTTRHQGRKICLKGELEELSEQIRQLQKRDSQAEAALADAQTYGNWAGRLFLMVILLAIAGLFLSIFMFGTGAAELTWAFGGFLALVCLLLGARHQWVVWQHGAHDLHNGKLQLLADLVWALGPDSTGRFSLEIHPSNPRPRLSQMAGFGNLKETYGDEWLKLQTRLSDGTVVKIQASSWGGRSVRTRHKRKGMKHRVGPLRGSCQVTVQLALDSQAYPDVAPLLEKLPEPAGFTRQQVRALSGQNGKLTAQVRYLTSQYPDLKQVMQPLLWLYTGLRRGAGI